MTLYYLRISLYENIRIWSMPPPGSQGIPPPFCRPRGEREALCDDIGMYLHEGYVGKELLWDYVFRATGLGFGVPAIRSIIFRVLHPGPCIYGRYQL